MYEKLIEILNRSEIDENARQEAIRIVRSLQATSDLKTQLAKNIKTLAEDIMK